MKMNFKNYEIEGIMNVLNDDRNFLKNPAMKLPATFRHAMRINIKVLSERFDIYSEERVDYIKDQEKLGHVKFESDGSASYIPQYAQEVANELNELALADNELDIEGIPAEIARKVLEADLSMAEEDVIEMFIIPETD